ncbi:MAG: hypothetical protein OEM18_07010 [Nitrosopumilus sp.]|nr:hypothetical protein [Nitrosopumilus sp.]
MDKCFTIKNTKANGSTELTVITRLPSQIEKDSKRGFKKNKGLKLSLGKRGLRI